MLWKLSSMWFWFRAQQLSRRRSYMARSWGRLVQSDSAGVANSLVRVQGENEEELPSSNRLETNEHRGLLSLAVEFLFGPIPFAPGPTSLEKWKLRAAVILEQSARDGSATLSSLTPFFDDPPGSLTDTVKIQANGLAIVTHFHGIPKQMDDKEQHFIFPELLAESTHSTTYEEGADSDDGSWRALSMFLISYFVSDGSTAVIASRTTLPPYFARLETISHMRDHRVVESDWRLVADPFAPPWRGFE
ncbi:hypothetical protein MHU86_6592 [Fragilaria crotonensis]|nr:hypothetical protein MHU86_6592 [Fragilaria crotonensis]